MTRTRRFAAALLASASIAAAAPTVVAGPAHAASSDTRNQGKLERLVVQGPNNLVVAGALRQAVERGSLDTIADEVEYVQWNTPEELRARLVNGEAQVSAVPLNVAAQLYNRGVDVRLLHVSAWHLLSLVGPAGEEVDWDDLRGQTVHVPLRNDFPDLVFSALLDANDLEPGSDVTVEYVATPFELPPLLVAGRARYAVMPEPLTTVAIATAGGAGRPLARVLDLQDEWAAATGREDDGFPQVAVVVSGDLVDRSPKLVARLARALTSEAERLQADPAAGGAELSATFGVPAPLATQVIDSVGLDPTDATTAKPAVQRFLKELLRRNPDSVGNQLPPKRFYVRTTR